MKKLIEKLRLWLIRRLNAVPMDEHTELCREGISLLQRLERQEAEQKPADDQTAQDANGHGGAVPHD